MEQPLCKICRERHYGMCPPPVISSSTLPIKPTPAQMAGKFDRTAYQRTYMRQIREANKKSGARTHYVIYAVVLREHPNIVKLGQTCSWALRRTQYCGWNLADGDGILESAVYCITEEYTDLRNVEAECLYAMKRKPYRGNEWFEGTIIEARTVIEQSLARLGLSFTEI